MSTGSTSDDLNGVDLSAVLRALRALRGGDFRARLPEGETGIAGAVAEAFNDIAELNQRTAQELRRVSRAVGREGRIAHRVSIGSAGGWGHIEGSVNELVTDLTEPMVEISRVLEAVAKGDLSPRMPAESDGRGLKGEYRRTAHTINTMVDQLNAFASEVTRVAREVGTEGKLGGQADVRGVGGTWKDLTDSVNSMAGNLTAQVRNIADVTTAVARGDLSKKITVDVRGEILELKDTINTMVDQLNAFASEVTRVAREVGTEGKLGGQADVRGVGGTWKDLTDSVNQLAANLTTQVRAIGEVATAVTRGDLSRSIQVHAEGEVALLKDDVNKMIRNLRETTRRNNEIDWLKTNIARFSRMLQGERDVEVVGRSILSELAPLVGIQRGVFYLAEADGERRHLRLLATYPRTLTPAPEDVVAFGEGLLGQAAEDRRRLQLREVPPDYATIRSALGQSAPRSIVILPILFEDETRAVVELASLEELSEVHLAFLDQLAETIGIALSTITANRRAEDLVQEQAARAEAETGLARLRQIVDVMPEAILIADAGGRVYLSNAAAAEIMGVLPEYVSPGTAEATTGRRDGSHLLGDHPLARAVFQGEFVRGEQLVVTNATTGLDVPILVNSAPLRDGLGIPAGGVAVFQDISPLRDLDRQKDEFLAAISHDLKTPATIIKGNANLLQRAITRTDRDRSGEIAEGLEVIDESTAQLVRLVDELLDLTRLRMGHTLELDVGPTDLVRIVHRLAGEYRKISPRHTIDVETEVGRILGEWDEARIERIVANLISNAVKYSPRGAPIKIRVSEETRGEQTWALMVVRDHGIGIPAEELERIFEPYYRASNATGTVSGSGIGLAGTRHIVEQHGGEISVQSEKDGTTFMVRLPIALEPADQI